MAATVTQLGDIESTPTLDGLNITRNVIRHYRVVYDDAPQEFGDQTFPGAEAARLETGIPRLGDPHPTYNELVATTIDCKGAEPTYNRVYLVEVTYTFTTSFDGEEEPGTQNPLDEPAQINWSFNNTTEEMWQDLSDPPKPIVTTAGEPFEPSIEREIGTWLLTVTKNFAIDGLDPDKIVDFQNSVNETTWFGVAPGKAKFSEFSAVRNFSTYGGGLFYWTVTMGFEYRREGWQASVLNQGTYYYSTEDSPPKRLRFKDEADESTPQSGLVLLDEQGHKLSPGAEPVYLEFVRYESRDFNQLNLI